MTTTPARSAPPAVKAGAASSGLGLPDGGSSHTVAAIERAADILLYFTEVDSPDLGVTDIANALNMSKAAVHRVLASLRSRELIHLDADSRRYSLGPATLILGLTALSKANLRTLALEEMRTLSAETSETATLSVRSGMHRVYVDQVTPDHPYVIAVSIGRPYPLHAGSSSKAFLAFMPEDEVERYLAGSLPQVTSSTRTDLAKLRADLASIRKRGWADSAGERLSGAASVAAPVFDDRGRVIAVLSVCGPVDRFMPRRREYVKKLLAATQRLSTAMGYRPREWVQP